jgi:penicillin amidase
MGRPAGWIVALACALGLGTAPAAFGRVLDAEAVLPPGQSGFVALTGLTTGQGSPHLYDQLEPFKRFARRPFGFTTSGETEQPRDGVRIVRDAFGIPSVTGRTAYDTWWGAGYAVAQDRLFQLETFRRATSGRLAEILGQDYLDDDLIARRDFYTAAEVDEMVARLPRELVDRAQAYADGINAYAAVAKLNPALIPAEFAATLPLPLTTWTVRDSLTIGIFLARTVPSGDGAELRNLRAVQEAGGGAAGRRLLERLLPLRVEGQVATVPREDGRFPQGRPVGRREERRALTRSLAFAARLPAATPAQATAAARKADLPAGRLGRVGGSSMFAIADRRARRAVLFNGPQLGFSQPELFVELELHGPGIALRGVTAPGVPAIATGHNEDVAWGITSGLSDDDDLYAEELVDGDPEAYRFRGEVRRMDCRDEVFRFRSAVTDVVLGGQVPQLGSRTERICRTVHGPVQERGNGVAYARRYAIWGRELETFVGIDALNRARTIDDVDRAARQLTWNENLLAVDSQGRMGFWHPGLIQGRPRGWDQRLPLPGTGEAEWPGLVPRSRLPRSIDPRQGFLANWNTLPSQGWTTGDGEATERLGGPLHRGELLRRLVARAARRGPSMEAARDVVRRAGTVAQQRPLLGGRLRRAARGAAGGAATVLRTVLAWDGDYDRAAADGTVDPGVAAWEALRTKAMELALAPFGPAGRRFGTTTSSSHVFDFSNGMAYALRTLSDAQLRAAAATAAGTLRERFGTADPAGWRTPRRRYEWSIQGAGQPPEIPFFDRGTFEHITLVGDG